MDDRIKNAIDRVRDRSICWAELYYHAKLLADRINELETLLKMKERKDATILDELDLHEHRLPTADIPTT